MHAYPIKFALNFFNKSEHSRADFPVVITSSTIKTFELGFITKPLLKVKDVSLLDNCIELINNLNIKNILLNSFHLKEQINEFVDNHKYNIEIQVIEDGDKILDTGGGILNLIKNTT